MYFYVKGDFFSFTIFEKMISTPSTCWFERFNETIIHFNEISLNCT